MVMELENGSGNIAFAEHQNQQMVAARSNYVLSGLVITASVGSNLLDGSDDIDMSSGSSFNNNTFRSSISAGNLDLSSHYSGLSSGQSRFVFIYINTSGTLVSVAGTPAVTGQQLPPDIVDKTVVLAMITLTYLDTTVDIADIEDWQIEAPIGEYVNGDLYIGSIIAGVSDYDKFIVSDGGRLKFRTGDEIASDIGAISITLLNAYLAIGSGNSKEFPCLYTASDNPGTLKTTLNGYANTDTTNGEHVFQCVVPPTLGSLSLTITDIQVTVHSANETNFVTAIQIKGADIVAVDEVEYTDTTDLKTAGVKNSGSELSALTDFDASVYASILIALEFDVADASALTIAGVTLTGYYS